jgi:hypothetical protein
LIFKGLLLLCTGIFLRVIYKFNFWLRRRTTGCDTGEDESHSLHSEEEDSEAMPSEEEACQRRQEEEDDAATRLSEEEAAQPRQAVSEEC